MPASIHSRVFFNDGDPVDPADFNSMQTLRAIEQMDLMMGMINAADGEDPEAEPGTLGGVGARRCYVPRVAGAMPYNGGGLEVDTTQGWIYAKNPSGPTSPSGTDPTLLAFYVPAQSAIATLSAADPANPRIDLIQVRLDLIEDTPSVRDFEDGVSREITDSPSLNRHRRVQATWSVKEGTPAANPTRPTADAGYVEWACVRLPAAAANYGLEDLWDMRMPMRIEVQRVQPPQMGGGDTWAQGTDNDDPPPRVKTANDTKALWAIPHTGQMAGRIIGAGAAYILVNGAGGNEAIQLMRLEGENNPTKTEINDLFSDMGSTLGNRERSQVGTEFSGTSGGGMGNRPIWTNFYGAQELFGAGGLPAASSAWNRVAMRFRGDALSEVFEAWFFVATDL